MFGQSQKFGQLRHSDLSSRINRSRFLFGDGDDSIDDARKIRFSNRGSFEDSGRVSEDDPDYYKFTLRRSGNVKVNFQNRGEESIQFSIVDRRNRIVSVDGRRLFAEVDRNDKEKLTARLGQGIYFIRIEAPDGDNERYSIKLKLNSNRNSN